MRDLIVVGHLASNNGPAERMARPLPARLHDLVCGQSLSKPAVADNVKVLQGEARSLLAKKFPKKSVDPHVALALTVAAAFGIVGMPTDKRRWLTQSKNWPGCRASACAR